MNIITEKTFFVNGFRVCERKLYALFSPGIRAFYAPSSPSSLFLYSSALSSAPSAE